MPAWSPPAGSVRRGVQERQPCQRPRRRAHLPGSLVADASGRSPASLSFAPGTLAVGDKLTATATSPAGDTSGVRSQLDGRQPGLRSPSGLNAFGIRPWRTRSPALQTKTAGTPATIDVIVLNSWAPGLHAAFNNTVTLEWMNAADNTGTLDARNCRSSWTWPWHRRHGDLRRRRWRAAVRHPDAAGDAGRQWRLRLSATLLDGSTLRACATDAFAVRPARLSIDQGGRC